MFVSSYAKNDGEWTTAQVRKVEGLSIDEIKIERGNSDLTWITRVKNDINNQDSPDLITTEWNEQKKI